MPTIRNIKDLEKLLNPKIQKAMELTRDEAFEIVSRKVSDYYNEPVFDNTDPTVPKYYERGMDNMSLMESLTGSHVTQKNGQYSFTVGFDDEYLSFHYKKGFATKMYGGKYNGLTGEQVLQAFNSGTHGYTVQGEHNYWDEALSEIESRGGLDGIFKKYLKQLDVPIL